MSRPVKTWSLIAGALIISALTFAPALAEAAEETRTAVRKKARGRGWVTLPNGTRCNERGQDVIELTFPINGGPVTGTRKWWGRDAQDDRKPPRCSEYSRSQTITGTFSGGDGGTIDGWVVNDDPKRKRRYKLSGKVEADGKAYIRWSKYHKKKPVKLIFPAFCTATTDMNVYTAKARDVIKGEILNAAARHTYRGFRKGVEEGWKYLVQQAHLREAIKGTYVHRYSLNIAKRPPLPLMEELSLKFIPDRKKAMVIPATPLLGALAENLTTALSLIEAADSALDGDYATAAFQVAVEGIGLYSNSLGLLLALGQAVKADWDAFAKRYYAKEYRRFYEEMYYGGGKRPSMAVWKQSRRDRLRSFMETARDQLTGGGAGGSNSWSSGGGQSLAFRQMIMDFAKYRLEMELTYEDLATTDGPGGELVFRHKYLQSVFVSLFNDFEATYEKDVMAEAMAAVALKQAQLLGQKAELTKEQLTGAEDGRYEEVWTTENERRAAICRAISSAIKQMGGQGVYREQ